MYMSFASSRRNCNSSAHLFRFPFLLPFRLRSRHGSCAGAGGVVPRNAPSSEGDTIAERDRPAAFRSGFFGTIVSFLCQNASPTGLCTTGFTFSEAVLPGILANGKAPLQPSWPSKKLTWWSTRRYFTTSAYSLTSLPAAPGCPSFSHPTNLLPRHCTTPPGRNTTQERSGRCRKPPPGQVLTPVLPRSPRPR